MSSFLITSGGLALTLTDLASPKPLTWTPINNANNAQKWTSDGKYIVSVAGGFVLDDYNNKNVAGAQVGTWTKNTPVSTNQQWQFTADGFLQPDISVGSNLVLGKDASNNAILVDKANGLQITKKSSGAFLITSGGLALTLASLTGPKQLIWTPIDATNPAQQWQLDGKYIVSLVGGFVLDDYNNSNVAGAQVGSYTKNNPVSTNQQWQFTTDGFLQPDISVGSNLVLGKDASNNAILTDKANGLKITPTDSPQNFTVTFKNSSSSNVSVYYVSPSGTETDVLDLAPSQQKDLPSPVGAKYVMRATSGPAVIPGNLTVSKAETIELKNAAPPTAPTLHATANGTSSISLTWNAPASDLAIKKYILRVSPPSPPQSIDVGNVTSYTFSPVTPGTTYTFSVAAVNVSDVHGPFSPDVQVTIQAPPPPPPVGIPGLANGFHAYYGGTHPTFCVFRIRFNVNGTTITDAGTNYNGLSARSFSATYLGGDRVQFNISFQMGNGGIDNYVLVGSITAALYSPILTCNGAVILGTIIPFPAGDGGGVAPPPPTHSLSNGVHSFHNDSHPTFKVLRLIFNVNGTSITNAGTNYNGVPGQNFSGSWTGTNTISLNFSIHTGSGAIDNYNITGPISQNLFQSTIHVTGGVVVPVTFTA